MQLITSGLASLKAPAASPPAALHRDNIAIGMASAVLSMFGLATMNMFAKLVTATHSVIEVAFYRNVIGLLPIVAIMIFFDQWDILRVRGNPKLIVVRSVIGTISLMCTFSTFMYLPIADAQAFLFTSSLFVPVLGYFFLKERVGPYRWSAVLVGFCGMLIMLRPSEDPNYFGITLALSSALMHSVLATLLRLLGRTERPETVAFYFMVIGAVCMGVCMPFVATTPTKTELGYFLGAGISGGFAQLMLSVSYKYAPAALVTIFNYTGIVWATAYGWFIWRQWPTPTVWTGAAVIIGSSVLVVWREQVSARRGQRAALQVEAEPVATS